MHRGTRLGAAVLALGLSVWFMTDASAQLLVSGSPTYDSTTQTGLRDGYLPVAPGAVITNSGMGVGAQEKYVNGVDMGQRAVRWDASGAATELGTLAQGSGSINAIAKAVNLAGVVVGYSEKYVGSLNVGPRAVRWNAGSTAPTELGVLGVATNGSSYAEATVVTANGTAYGKSNQYVSGVDNGNRAVRWNVGSTTPVELQNLGGGLNGITHAGVDAINSSGVAVGYTERFSGGTGYRAVRWNAAGQITELPLTSTSSSGQANGEAEAISETGIAVGFSYIYSGTTNTGGQAVRWSSSGVATALANLGRNNNSGFEGGGAYAVNASGTAVGWSHKYVNNVPKGQHAVLWAASGSAATELPGLGTDVNGSANSDAFGINDAGTAIGRAQKYVANSPVGFHAVAWLPDSSVVDLNTLNVMPASGSGTWTLTTANGISTDGWIAGEGQFDPDGAGPLPDYKRYWVGQVGLGGSWLNTSNANNTWGKGVNWSTGTPAIQLDATFNSNATYTVALDKNEQARTIAIATGVVSFSTAGHTLSANSFNIAPAGTLKGTGAINAAVSNSGTIAPGNSPGTLNITGSLTNTGVLNMEIASLLNLDEIDVTGNMFIGGVIDINFLGGFTPSLGDSFDLMNWTGSFTNTGYTFNFSDAMLGPGLVWDTSAFGSTGAISVASFIPEPAAMSMLALCGFTLLRRQRRIL